MHYLLFYEFTEDYLVKREEFRDDHLKLAWNAHEAGELILGGAFADPADGAVLFFQGESPDVAEKFAKSDPYLLNGIVKKWHVRKWTTVVGKDSASPVFPKKP